MLLFMFFVIAAGTLYIFLYYNKKVYEQKKRIMLLHRQNDLIKVKYPKNLSVHYSTPEYRYGQTLDNCPLYIAPIESSTQLLSIKKQTPIIIIDCASLQGINWYEVIVPSMDRVNNKGWIKAIFVMFPEENKKIAPA